MFTYDHDSPLFSIATCTTVGAPRPLPAWQSKRGKRATTCWTCDCDYFNHVTCYATSCHMLRDAICYTMPYVTSCHMLNHAMLCCTTAIVLFSCHAVACQAKLHYAHAGRAASVLSPWNRDARNPELAACIIPCYICSPWWNPRKPWQRWRHWVAVRALRKRENGKWRQLTRTLQGLWIQSLESFHYGSRVLYQNSKIIEILCFPLLNKIKPRKIRHITAGKSRKPQLALLHSLKQQQQQQQQQL